MVPELAAVLEAALGASIVRARPVHGGDVATAYAVDLSDQRRVVAKTHPRAPAQCVVHPPVLHVVPQSEPEVHADLQPPPQLLLQVAASHAISQPPQLFASLVVSAQ